MRMPLSLLTVILLGTAAMSQAGSGHSGFFHAEQRDGRWWLIDPDGKPFISKGVDTIQFAQDCILGTRVSPYGETNKRKYGSPEAWRKAIALRLWNWGFNTLGAWSDVKLAELDINGRHLAYTVNLDFGSRAVSEMMKGKQAWLHGVFPDVFDPNFERIARRIAQERCVPRKDDRHLLGWFTDNELRWGADWRGKEELLTMFLNLPAGAPGRAAAIAALRERHADIAKFNAVWKTGFASWEDLAKAAEIRQPFENRKRAAQNAEINREDGGAVAAFGQDCDLFSGRVAERYFQVTGGAIRAADPNHMNFGCRFAYVPAKPIVDVAGRSLDGVSFNCYQKDPREIIQKYSVFGKPLIIGEFSFRGEDSGLPNTKGAGPRVKTQVDRAAAFENYVRMALSMPNLVVYHWFEHADEPKEGRFDGENSSYGLVNIHDEPYEELTQRMKKINAQAEALHR